MGCGITILKVFCAELLGTFILVFLGDASVAQVSGKCPHTILEAEVDKVLADAFKCRVMSVKIFLPIISLL